jgi:hypothetical protein
VRSRNDYLYGLDLDDEDLDDSESVDYDEVDDAPRSTLRSRLRSRVQSRVDSTRERLRASRAAASDKVSQAMDVTRERTAEVRGRLSTLLEEQPLVFGALAVAVGALIGAALPTTEVENRTVGQVRDRTLEKARQMGQRQYETLRTKLAPEEVEITQARTEH